MHEQSSTICSETHASITTTGLGTLLTQWSGHRVTTATIGVLGCRIMQSKLCIRAVARDMMYVSVKEGYVVTH